MVFKVNHSLNEFQYKPPIGRKHTPICKKSIILTSDFVLLISAWLKRIIVFGFMFTSNVTDVSVFFKLGKKW